MLKKENRLSSKFEFNIVHKHGHKVISQIFFVYKLRPKVYEGPAKIGAVVSNKVDKRAVIRNKMKRLTREAARQNIILFEPNHWYTIHPRKVILDKSYEEISSDLAKTVQKLSVS